MGRKGRKGNKLKWSLLDTATKSSDTSLPKENVTQDKPTTENKSSTELDHVSTSSAMESTDSFNSATRRDITTSNTGSTWELDVTQDELNIDNEKSESKASSSEMVVTQGAQANTHREMKNLNSGKCLDKQLYKNTSLKGSESKKEYSGRQSNPSLNTISTNTDNGRKSLFPNNNSCYNKKEYNENNNKYFKKPKDVIEGRQHSRSSSREKHSSGNNEYVSSASAAYDSWNDKQFNKVNLKTNDYNDSDRNRNRSHSRDKQYSDNNGNRVCNDNQSNKVSLNTKEYNDSDRKRNCSHSRDKQYSGNNGSTVSSANRGDSRGKSWESSLSSQSSMQPNKSHDRNSRSRQFDNSSERKSRNDYDYDKFMKEYADKNKAYKIVIEVQGDLFLAGKEYSLGHCVAEDMNMGAGVAVTFRQLFKRIQDLLEQRQTQGGVAVLEDEGRYIYYLVTKRMSSGKPTYYTFWSSLLKMKDHITQNNVKKLALPRIGCGLDGLEWILVKNMLEFIFRDVDIEIKIFNFQQDAHDIPPVQRIHKCAVFNVSYPIVNIEYGTVILYFGSEDGVQTDEIKLLSEKFPFVSNVYRIEKKTAGTCIHTDRYSDGYCFYGCIVRKRHADPFSFVDFQKCLKTIQIQNRKDKYEYIAFQAFKENDNTIIVSKIVNLMRHSLTNIKVYVCWPEELQGHMPYNNY